jgi:Uma2 family endonuclease
MSVELETPVISPYAEIGEAEEKNMAMGVHGKVCTNISGNLFIYLKTHKLGHLLDSSVIYNFPNKPPKRLPDVSFIPFAKLPIVKNEEITVAPDLVVEVVSKNDTGNEILDKINQYLQVGVQLIWIVYPSRKQVFVHRQNRSVSFFDIANNDQLGGENILPGFKLPLVDVFEGIEHEDAQTLDSIE